MTRKKTREEHVAELTVHGRVELVGDYVSDTDRTIYRCIAHGEEHAATPGNVRRGQGLSCCRKAAARRAFTKHTEAHVADLALHGRVVLVGAYTNNATKTLYRCLQHGEVHEALPRHCRGGHGLRCCLGAETLEAALAGTHRFAKAEKTDFYIYELLNHEGYLKPGIAKSHEDRADREYGALVSAWERYHRTLVYLPEQVLLKATRLMAHCPSALAGWGGASEVRRMDADALVSLAQELMDEMDACANPWEFAIAHGLLTPAQEKRARVLINAGVISEAELARVEAAA